MFECKKGSDPCDCRPPFELFSDFLVELRFNEGRKKGDGLFSSTVSKRGKECLPGSKIYMKRNNIA